MSTPSLSDAQIARREELRQVVTVASQLLNPDQLERWRQLQGVAYFELDALGDGRQEAAALVGLGPKAIDWSRNKYRGAEIDPAAEFRSLMAPVIKLLKDSGQLDTLLSRDEVSA